MAFLRNILLLLPFIATILLNIYGCSSDTEEQKPTVSTHQVLHVEGYIVEPQPFENQISVSGSLVPNEQIVIRPEISGRVTEILFREGSYVSKGTLLVQLNASEIRAQIEKLKAQKQLQQTILTRQQELVTIGGISRQEYETTETQVATINAEIAFQEAQLRKTRIVAPFSGRIGIRNISKGAIVSPETEITTLQQLNPLKIDFSIPAELKNNIEIGKHIFFKPSGSNQSFTGKISAIDPGAETTTRTVRVRALVPNPKNELLAGAFVHVEVPLMRSENTMLIPSQAVIPTTRDKKVAIIHNGKARLVEVELGTRTQDKVIIKSGLSAGDTVITTGVMRVRPGMNVEITQFVE